MTAPTLIGLAGYARSGKDTVAAILRGAYGHQVLSFSDVLREFLYAQNLTIPNNWGYSIQLNDVVDEFGWEEARDRYPVIRDLQQLTGTEAGRQILGEHVWLQAWARRTLVGSWVNPSVRFVNEADTVRDMGGKVYRVVRPGVGPVNAHASDTALDDYDFDAIIYNAGSFEDLKDEIQRVVCPPAVTTW